MPGVGDGQGSLACCSPWGHKESGTTELVTPCYPLDSSVCEISQQEYWNRLPCPPPGDLPDPGIEPVSPLSPAILADLLPLSHLLEEFFGTILILLKVQ